MSKIICDICGSEYDDSVGACPVCGWDQSGDLPEDIEDFDSDFLDVIQEEAAAPVVAPVVPAEPAPKSKVAFDYDAANRRARPAPKKPAPPVEDEDDEEDEEEEESGSNAFLVIILVLLILALLAVSGYIGWT